MRKKLSEVCEFYTGTGFQPGADSEGKEIFSGEIKRRAFKGIDQILPEEHIKKMWEMLWKRWKKYVEICN